MQLVDRTLARWAATGTVDQRIVDRSQSVDVRRVSLLRFTAQSRGSDRMYAVEIKPWRRAVWCSCPDSMVRKHTCKHSAAALRELLS
jgi:uncharacterized Zn finger protein